VAAGALRGDAEHQHLLLLEPGRELVDEALGVGAVDGQAAALDAERKRQGRRLLEILGEL